MCAQYSWMMRKVLDNDAAWANGFMNVALSIFDAISGGDGEMDIEEVDMKSARCPHACQPKQACAHK